MRLFLIRHTTPILDEKKLISDYCYGQSDLQLATTFHEEALQVQEKFKQYQLQGKLNIFSSPLIRCRKLAASLFPDHQIEWEPRLQEMHFGKWELQAWEKISRDEVECWKNDLMYYKPGAGESFSELVGRCQNFLECIKQRSFSETDAVVCITHSGPIRALMQLQLQLPPEQSIAISIPFGYIAEFQV